MERSVMSRYQNQKKINMEYSIGFIPNLYVGSLSISIGLNSRGKKKKKALHFILVNTYFLKILNLFLIWTEIYNLCSWFWNCSISPKPRKMYHCILKKLKNTIIFSSFVIMLISKQICLYKIRNIVLGKGDIGWLRWQLRNAIFPSSSGLSLYFFISIFYFFKFWFVTLNHYFLLRKIVDSEAVNLQKR